MEEFLHLYLRVAPGKISFLKFILEGYDGLAVLSTMDATVGLVRLLFPASRLRELLDLLNELGPELEGMSTAGAAGIHVND